jgi:hypothetical protein
VKKAHYDAALSGKDGAAFLFAIMFWRLPAKGGAF